MTLYSDQWWHVRSLGAGTEYQLVQILAWGIGNVIVIALEAGWLDRDRPSVVRLSDLRMNRPDR